MGGVRVRGVLYSSVDSSAEGFAADVLLGGGSGWKGRHWGHGRAGSVSYLLLPYCLFASCLPHRELLLSVVPPAWEP